MIQNRLTTSIIACSISLSISLIAQDVPSPPSWKSKDGRAIQAQFVKLEGESVVVEKDGKNVTISFAKLADESVAQAKKLGSVNSQSTAENASIDPRQYLGKPFDDCEKTLGKPSDVRTLSEKNSVFVRRYASKTERFDYIELISDGTRFEKGTLPPKTVTSISFGLKKEPECDFGKCYQKPNHKATSLEELYGIFGFKNLDKTALQNHKDITQKTILHPAFGYIVPDGGSLSGFRMMIPGEYGNVQSEYWSIQWLTSEDADQLALAEKTKAEPSGAVESESTKAYVKSLQPRENAEVRFYFVHSARKP